MPPAPTICTASMPGLLRANRPFSLLRLLSVSCAIALIPRADAALLLPLFRRGASCGAVAGGFRPNRVADPPATEATRPCTKIAPNPRATPLPSPTPGWHGGHAHLAAQHDTCGRANGKATYRRHPDKTADNKELSTPVRISACCLHNPCGGCTWRHTPTSRTGRPAEVEGRNCR